MPASRAFASVFPPALRRGVVRTVATIALLLPAASAGATVLTVSPDGVLLKDGQPYRGVGVNVADAYHRLWMHPGDFTYDRDFATLEAEGIPFARIPATAYSASDLQHYLTNQPDYLQKLDGVVRSAERHHIGLIMDLFWWDAAVPDISHEPRIAWGDANSRTVAFMRDYTHTLVGRYKDSPAIWAWEFGNEFSLSADLPNAADWRPPIDPGIGWPARRTKADDLTTAEILVAFTQFAEAVHDIDPTAAVTTGNSLPRPSAELQRKTLHWGALDTRAQFRANLALVNPDPMNIISVHLYAFDLHDRFRHGTISYDDVIGQAMEASRAAKKPLFIGEMGSAVGWFGLQTADEVKRDFEARLKAIVDTRVPLSAVWQISSSLTFWNDPLTINRDKGLGYMLDDMKDANAQIAAQLAGEARLADLLPKFETAIQAGGTATVRAVQELLTHRGFAVGRDGQYGPATKRALSACIEAGTCTAEDVPTAQ